MSPANFYLHFLAVDRKPPRRLQSCLANLTSDKSVFDLIGPRHHRDCLITQPRSCVNLSNPLIHLPTLTPSQLDTFRARTYGWNFCLIIEFSIIGISNYWAIIAATHGKRAAPTTIIESSIIKQKFQALLLEKPVKFGAL